MAAWQRGVGFEGVGSERLRKASQQGWRMGSFHLPMLWSLSRAFLRRPPGSEVQHAFLVKGTVSRREMVVSEKKTRTVLGGKKPSLR